METKMKWIYDIDNCMVITEDKQNVVFHTVNLLCPKQVIQNVVDIFNNSIQDYVIGSGGDVDEYLLDEGEITTDDKEYICGEIVRNYYHKLNGVDENQYLIDKVVRQIQKDVNEGDVTSLEELLKKLPNNVLESYLPEINL